jgi:hypothetical protein
MPPLLPPDDSPERLQISDAAPILMMIARLRRLAAPPKIETRDKEEIPERVGL